MPERGVALNAPPPHLISDAIQSISMAMADVPKDAKGAIVAVTTDTGTNAALAVHGPAGVDVLLWMGKSWGEKVHYGATVVKVLRW
jgi:hypothetical protein